MNFRVLIVVIIVVAGGVGTAVVAKVRQDHDRVRNEFEAITRIQNATISENFSIYRNAVTSGAPAMQSNAGRRYVDAHEQAIVKHDALQKINEQLKTETDPVTKAAMTKQAADLSAEFRKLQAVKLDAH